MATGPSKAASVAGCVFLAARVAFCFVVVVLFTLMVASCVAFLARSAVPRVAVVEMPSKPLRPTDKSSLTLQRYPFVRKRDTDT